MICDIGKTDLKFFQKDSDMPKDLLRICMKDGILAKEKDPGSCT